MTLTQLHKLNQMLLAANASLYDAYEMLSDNAADSDDTLYKDAQILQQAIYDILHVHNHVTLMCDINESLRSQSH